MRGLDRVGAGRADDRCAEILVYHRFGPAVAFTTVLDAALDEQLAWLASHVRVAPLREVLGALQAG